jgi:hypothetical protein
MRKGSTQLHDCEDAESAVATMLRWSWDELRRREPEQINRCLKAVAAGRVARSYVALLQCVTRTGEEFVE